ncbi:MAG TPA: HDOD domain-containing protein, partial [Myxococcales bacterium]|nr:HDOD domain-containing protein [Myxococcales bacterium]
HFRAVFQQATTCAMAAAAVALRAPRVNSDHAYLGGLLHHVGKSVALRSLAALKLNPDPARVARVLEKVHVVIGEDIHRAWSLPDYLVRIATHHHDGQVLPDEAMDLHVVRLVSSLHGLRLEPGLNPRAFVEVWESATVLELDPYALRAVDTELRQLAAAAEQLDLSVSRAS